MAEDFALRMSTPKTKGFFPLSGPFTVDKRRRTPLSISHTSTLDGGRGSKFPGQLLLAVTTQPNQTATGIEIII